MSSGSSSVLARLGVMQVVFKTASKRSKKKLDVTIDNASSLLQFWKGDRAHSTTDLRSAKHIILPKAAGKMVVGVRFAMNSEMTHVDLHCQSGEQYEATVAAFNSVIRSNKLHVHTNGVPMYYENIAVSGVRLFVKKCHVLINLENRSIELIAKKKFTTTHAFPGPFERLQRSTNHRECVVVFSDQTLTFTLPTLEARELFATALLAFYDANHRSAPMFSGCEDSKAPGNAVPERKRLRVFIGSFNVGNTPLPENLGEWLLPKAGSGESERDEEDARKKKIPQNRYLAKRESSSSAPSTPTSLSPSLSDPVDIYALGLQEAVIDSRSSTALRRNTQNLVNTVGTLVNYSGPQRDLLQQIDSVLGDSYTAVGSACMAGIRHFVYVRKELAQWVTNVEAETEATGIAHVLGNKGGVAIGMHIFDTRVCFVTSHLAAHQQKVKQRNSDVAEIFAGLNFYKKSENIAGSGMRGRQQLDIMGTFDHIFWSGDLNYRIDMERERCIQHAEKRRFGDLQRDDQLRREIAEKRVFVGWRMEMPNFPPTYKYIPGETSNGKRVYDAKKMRIPSWCDRVLWYSRNGMATDISLRHQGCCDKVISSDHSPVFSLFDLDLSLPFSRSFSGPRCTLRFLSLSCEELESADPNGLADPYIMFRSRILRENVCTDVRMKTLSPAWGEREIPALRLMYAHPEFLKAQSIAVTVIDHDVATQDDLMGFAHIPLAEVMDKTKASFMYTVFMQGRAAGVISGEMQVVWDREETLLPV